jgi:hypothetical protein
MDANRTFPRKRISLLHIFFRYMLNFNLWKLNSYFVHLCALYTTFPFYSSIKLQRFYFQVMNKIPLIKLDFYITEFRSA